MLLAFNGHSAMGQFLGDTIVALKTAYLFAQNHPCGRYLLALSPKGDLNFLWSKFIRTYNVQVIYDSFEPGNMEQRFNTWNQWFKEREIDGVKFDLYRELYRRIDGGHRQGKLCGGEKGLGRKNVFEYTYFGQEDAKETCLGSDRFEADLIDHPPLKNTYDVLIAPYAKCQGNAKFTFGYWDQVVRRLVDVGVSVTVAHNGGFCDDLLDRPNYRKFFQSYQYLLDEVCQHRLVCCGNTGVGWLGAAAGVPLLAMQPIDSHMQDYRYEWCGVETLVEFLEEPDVDYCVSRVVEEVSKRVVFTSGCFDILHGGHVGHLNHSKALGTHLVVGLNSDDSVRRLKGNDRPYHKLQDRIDVLKGLRAVDEVRVFEEDTPLNLIQRLRPAVITGGTDKKADEMVGKDLVESYGGSVVITDGNIPTRTTKTLERVNRTDLILKAIRDGGHLSVNPFHKLRLMADQFLATIDLKGDVADLGAYRGGTSLILRRLAPQKNLHLFDTWKGNPYTDPLCHHKAGEWAASLDECKRAVGQDEHTFYHEGIFPETTKQLLKTVMFSFVFVDPDTYQSVKAAIEYFWPRMVKGGKLFFDDVPDWPPCAGAEKAVREAFKEEHLEMFRESHCCVATK
jgi:rfaE bifunctional protein nucleotidyltransferase chain/domain